MGTDSERQERDRKPPGKCLKRKGNPRNLLNVLPAGIGAGRLDSKARVVAIPILFVLIFLFGLIAGINIDGNWRLGYRQAFIDMKEQAAAAKAEGRSYFVLPKAPQGVRFVTPTGKSVIVVFERQEPTIVGAGDEGPRRFYGN